MFNLTKAKGILTTVTTTVLLSSSIILTGFSDVGEEETAEQITTPIYEAPVNVLEEPTINLPEIEIPVDRIENIQYIQLKELSFEVNDYNNPSDVHGIHSKGTILTVRANLSNGWFELLNGGYIREETVEVREELGNRIFVKVTAESLNVRAEASARSKKLGALPEGELRTVTSVTDNGWYELYDGSFINSKYTVRLDVTKEEFYRMVEERKAKIRAEIKRQAELKAKAKAEAERKAKLAAQQKKVVVSAPEKAVKSATSTTSSGKYSSINLTSAERELLARLVYCEANAEPYSGQVGVAQVVFNRVLDDRFPNSVEGVIKAKGQFVPVSTGKIYNITPTAENYAAVDEALASSGLNGAVYFHNPKYSGGAWWNSLTTVASIGSHSFKK